MVISGIALHIALVLFPLLVYQVFFFDRFQSSSVKRRLLIGLYGGLTAILCEIAPVNVDGTLFDFKAIPVILAMLYGGPFAGAIGLVIALVFRAGVGNAGVLLALVSMLLYGALSYFFSRRFYTWNRRRRVWSAVIVSLLSLVIQVWFAVLFMALHGHLNAFYPYVKEHHFLVAGVAVQVLTTCVAAMTMENLNEQAYIRAAIVRSQTALAHAHRIARLGAWDWDLAKNRITYSTPTYDIFRIDPFFLGCTYEQFLTIVHLEDRAMVDAAVQECIKGIPFDMEYRLAFPDGRIHVTHARGDVIYNSTGEPVRMLGTLQDVTEVRRTEDLLRRSEKLSAVGQLAAGVAHEIRNPLTALKGFLQLLSTSIPMAQHHYYEVMMNELTRIELIASELLVLAKPQQRDFKPVNVVNVLEHVVVLLETQAIMSNIQIVQEYATDAQVNGDENQLKQAFINIVRNAIDAMPDGGVIAVSLRATDGQVCVQIKDQGAGIPSDVVDKLGEPFYTTKEKGTGLGLMITHNIIERHCGSVAYDSEVDVGTAVTVQFPQCALQTADIS